jgi:hypothetical protein
MDSLSELIKNPIIKITAIIAAIILLVLIIYKANKMYQLRKLNEPIFFARPNMNNFFRDTTKPYMILPAKIPMSTYGMEYSYSFWLNIDNWNYRYGKVKHVLHKGPQNVKVCNPGVFLHPIKNQLIIRVDTPESANIYKVAKDSQPDIINVRNKKIEQNANLYDVREADCKRECTANKDCNTFSLDKIANQCTFFSNVVDLGDKTTGTKGDIETKDSINTYVKVKDMNPLNYDTYELDNLQPCDIVDLPLQRWNHIAIVLWNRSLDVYLNGKLARSCTLRNVPVLNDGPLWLTLDDGFKGDMASVKYYNNAINAKKVYALYEKGPDSGSILKNLIPNINIKFSASASADVADETA